jgi:hypothetical protein
MSVQIRVCRSQQPATSPPPWPPAEMPPKALHNNNVSLTRKRRRPLHLHWAVALIPPPSPQVETGRRTRHRRCPPRLPRSGVACPPSFDSTLSLSLSSSSSLRDDQAENVSFSLVTMELKLMAVTSMFLW